MKVLRMSFLILVCTMGSRAFAQSGDAKTDFPMSDLSVRKNEVPGQDVDTIITNNKMRAETGSKSRYSVAMSMGYAGGSLEKPLDERRPNIAQGTGATQFANLSGAVSGKLGLTSASSLLAGAGVRWITPFQGTATPEGFNGQKVDADNPYLIYQYLYRWYGIQSAVQAQGTYFTNSNLVKEGYVTTFGLSQNNVYALGDSGLSAGLFGYVGVGYFNVNTPEAKADQSDYSFGLQPFLEYQVTPRLNVRTSSNLATFQHIRNNPSGNTYQRQEVTQSLGLGVAVTRDFFVSPSLEFVPKDIRADRTTVSLGANINLF